MIIVERTTKLGMPIRIKLNDGNHDFTEDAAVELVNKLAAVGIRHRQAGHPMSNTAMGIIDATGRQAGTCISYHPVRKVCELAGYCPIRNRKEPTRCPSGGKATWCGVALRGRG